MSTGSVDSSSEIPTHLGSKPMPTDVPTLQRYLVGTVRAREDFRGQVNALTARLVAADHARADSDERLMRLDAEHRMIRQQQEQRIRDLDHQLQAMRVELHARRDSVASSASSSPPRTLAPGPIDPRCPESVKTELQRLYAELAASQDMCRGLGAQMTQRAEQQEQQDQLQYKHWTENLEKLFTENGVLQQRVTQLENELQAAKERTMGASAAAVLPAQQEKRKEAPTAMDVEPLTQAAQAAASKPVVPPSEPLSRLSSVESTATAGHGSSAQSSVSSPPIPAPAPAPAAPAAAATAAVAVAPSGAGTAGKMWRLPANRIAKAPIAAQSAAAVVAAAAAVTPPPVAVHSTPSIQPVLTAQVSSPSASTSSAASSVIPSPPVTPHSSAPFAAAATTPPQSTPLPLPRSGGGKRFTLANLKRGSTALTASPATTLSDASPRSHIDMAHASPLRVESSSLRTTPTSASPLPPPSFALPPHSPALQTASSVHSAASMLSAATPDVSSASKRARHGVPPFQLSPCSPQTAADFFAEMPSLCR